MSEFPEKILAAWNDREWNTILALHHDDYREHLQSPDLPPGLEGLKVVYDLFSTAFPDFQAELGATASGNGNRKVGYHWILSGTHQGDFMGLPATGNAFKMNAMTMLTEVDGKCKESWSVMDMAGLMQQLDAGH